MKIEMILKEAQKEFESLAIYALEQTTPWLEEFREGWERYLCMHNEKMRKIHSKDLEKAEYYKKNDPAYSALISDAAPIIDYIRETKIKTGKVKFPSKWELAVNFSYALFGSLPKNKRKDISILEIGCGGTYDTNSYYHGGPFVARFLADIGFDVTAIDGCLEKFLDQEVEKEFNLKVENITSQKLFARDGKKYDFIYAITPYNGICCYERMAPELGLKVNGIFLAVQPESWIAAIGKLICPEIYLEGSFTPHRIYNGNFIVSVYVNVFEIGKSKRIYSWC